ncbi:proprotein convertase subtilisin/kexin type 7-like isoform X2 [Macrobrachium rosenbergii]|uniref:proprotein convertase subtilisin/kexin type 7-like isoform X2 n=2 Tax=Macrobrachium rosenbergii TaxID=79674 RepID=UPI0034D4625B
MFVDRAFGSLYSCVKVSSGLLWHKCKEELGTTMDSSLHALCCLPKSKPSGCLFLHTLLLCLVMRVTGDIDPSEYRHRGDLHLKRGSSVYSLAWVVELKDKCIISDVIKNVSTRNRKTVQDSKKEFSSDTRRLLPNHKLRTKDSVPSSRFLSVDLTSNYCSVDVPTQLILLKKLTSFEKTYIVAHPYFKIYSKEKRRWKQREKRFHQSLYSATNETREMYSTYNWKKLKGSDMFLFLESCLKLYLDSHPCVSFAKQEVLRSRQKRSIEFHDPLYSEQWHLKSNIKGQYDINVIGVWESGIAGRGVTVCVIDDGLEWQHPDLRDNYNPAGSYDINSDDSDPSPVKNERNEHGTRCAGEIAAVANSVCGVGVAYQANISGIRVLGGRMTDSMEAAAFIQGLEVNDIYSCSWGPDDDGKTVDGPHHLASKALIHGITYGRKGYGAIYVVASGNGGKSRDNCNFDGYANSVYTVTIGAVNYKGQMPYYAEECAAMLAVTPSSDSNGHDIVTTDWREISPSGCTKHHSGTSAAAPLAAAVVALALEVQPCLSWRDIQHLIVLTSRKIDAANSDWATNGADLHHSHQHGFGLIDASAMVSAATVWESVPFSTSFTSNMMYVYLTMPVKRLGEVTVKLDVDQNMIEGYALRSLEFVQVRVTIEHEYRGSLKIILICPSGTRSILATPRDADNSTKGFKDWAFGTVRCWGEDPVGRYQLKVIHTRHQSLKGTLVSWQLILHGSSMTPEELQRRRGTVNRAIRGENVHVNRSHLCHPPELRFKQFEPLPDRWLKAFVITGIFFMFMAILNSVEYIFCYNDEKEKFYKKLKDLADGRAMTQRSSTSRKAAASDLHCSNMEAGGSQAVIFERHLPASQSNEVLPLMTVDRVASPSLSCDADISSLNGESDDDVLSSHCNSDNVIPKDTDVTDFTNDEYLSEAEDDRRISEPPEVVCDNQ